MTRRSRMEPLAGSWGPATGGVTESARAGPHHSPPEFRVEVDSANGSWQQILVRHGLATLIVIWLMFWVYPDIRARWDRQQAEQEKVNAKLGQVLDRLAESSKDQAATLRAQLELQARRR